MLINYHQKCRVCGNMSFRPILNLGEHYLHGSFEYPDFKPPTRKVPVNLLMCDTQYGGCGLVQLEHSIDSDILYARYGYRSSTNETMKQHLSYIANKAQKIHNFKDFRGFNPDIECLDIGANDGYLLSQYPEEFKKTGIDPCDIVSPFDIKNCTFIKDLYPSTQIRHRSFNLITFIACFYDVNDPVDVARNLAKNLGKNGLLALEVSYWPTKMVQNAFDDLCSEHVAFYNYQNLEYIFGQAGLKIIDAELNDINGGSILLWITHKENFNFDTKEGKARILAIKFDEFNQALDTITPYKEFADRCFNLKMEVQELFDKIKKEGKSVHLYGASTKGNVLLQYFGLDYRDIPFAAERNPQKWNGSTLGTSIKMISEEASRAMKPDYYFVPIWSFKKEILEREKEALANNTKFIFPLPNLEVIGQ